MTPQERVAVIFAETDFCPENYKGETDENGLPHGKGTMKYEKRVTFAWFWLMDDSIAPKRYEGQWEHGVRCGEGKMTFWPGHPKGDWANGVKAALLCGPGH